MESASPGSYVAEVWSPEEKNLRDEGSSGSPIRLPAKDVGAISCTIEPCGAVQGVV